MRVAPTELPAAITAGRIGVQESWPSHTAAAPLPVQELAALLQHADSDVRQAAVVWLAQDAAGLVVLPPLLDDPDRGHRLAALHGLVDALHAGRLSDAVAAAAGERLHQAVADAALPVDRRLDAALALFHLKLVRAADVPALVALARRMPIGAPPGWRSMWRLDLEQQYPPLTWWDLLAVLEQVPPTPAGIAWLEQVSIPGPRTSREFTTAARLLRRRLAG